MPRLIYDRTLLRRSITIPVLIAFCVFAFALMPLVLLGDAVLPRRRGRRLRRASRFALFLGSYLSAELSGLVRGAWVWIRFGRGVRAGDAAAQEAYTEANLRILETLLGRLAGSAARRFGLRFGEVTASQDGGGPYTRGPLLVFSRHAGPGDSFLLVYALTAFAHRRPRIVLKSALCLDPLADLMVGRLPHRFVRPRAEDDEAAGRADVASIGALTAGMGPRDALVLFPEGGNFTPKRRRRVIASLRRRRMPTAAARAARLRHVLPPRPAGLFAALDAAPEGSCAVFVAHTGLDHIETVRAAWRAVPLTRPVEVAWWQVMPQDAPDAQRPEEERLAWLQDQWVRVDRWIDEHRRAAEAVETAQAAAETAGAVLSEVATAQDDAAARTSAPAPAPDQPGGRLGPLQPIGSADTAGGHTLAEGARIADGD